ncbi:uncharacterized protein MYCFIDRAFT_176224 [Pseudocercospora fijiensis CIRAD86]|uniref:Uncharacterized protein n=1 Tax=Pseudocercospora fijiensis (strain CIRAD86) TaxID=383855 RepID=M3A8B9_PSEFD|nr:uncharacterized protein MYCFIDRAFT_176224 [Pseudocercospora fijiensis CIRAD86]EME80856.1 hypothetical protein MYCFIDRAFT_176224 [Pseudocercospora fijiensis CIRAD86]
MCVRTQLHAAASSCNLSVPTLSCLLARLLEEIGYKGTVGPITLYEDNQLAPYWVYGRSLVALLSLLRLVYCKAAIKSAAQPTTNLTACFHPPNTPLFALALWPALFGRMYAIRGSVTYMMPKAATAHFIFGLSVDWPSSEYIISYISSSTGSRFRFAPGLEWHGMIWNGMIFGGRIARTRGGITYGELMQGAEKRKAESYRGSGSRAAHDQQYDHTASESLTASATTTQLASRSRSIVCGWLLHSAVICEERSDEYRATTSTERARTTNAIFAACAFLDLCECSIQSVPQFEPSAASAYLEECERSFRLILSSIIVLPAFVVWSYGRIALSPYRPFAVWLSPLLQPDVVSGENLFQTPKYALHLRDLVSPCPLHRPYRRLRIKFPINEAVQCDKNQKS